MKFLTYDGEIELDVHELIMDIDTIFHDRITKRTNALISHRKIQSFVVNIIRKNNKDMMNLRRAEEVINTRTEKRENEFNKKITCGKTVKNLDGIINKLKYYCLGYITYLEVKTMILMNINKLKEIYKFKETDQIENFINQHPYLSTPLLKIHEQIQRNFGEHENIILELYTEPEHPDDIELIVNIKTKLDVDEGYERMDKFDVWFINFPYNVRELICVVLEW